MSNSELTEINRAIVEGFYSAVMRGDIEDLIGRMDENVLVHEPPYLPYGGVYKGREGFLRQLFPALVKYLDITSLKIPYLIADGDRVIGCLVMKERKTGGEICVLEQSTLLNGKIIEMKLFYFDASLIISAQQDGN